MSVCVGNYAKYYSVEGFLRKIRDADTFSDKISANYSRIASGDRSDEEVRAWKDCYDNLFPALASLPRNLKGALNIVFEYVLPDYAPWDERFKTENHLRSDVVIFSGKKAVILEFKQAKDYFPGYRRQAQKYGRRLRKYHVASRDMHIRTIVVLTKAKGVYYYDKGAVICSPDNLSYSIKRLFGAKTAKANAYKWLNSGFYFRRDEKTEDNLIDTN